MKDIVLITNYWHFACEKASSRYLTLAEMLSAEADVSLEVVTSSFRHMTKAQRTFSDEFLHSFPYRMTLIPEPGYQKNISLQRLKSHRLFAKNVLHYLESRTQPDLIYQVVPSLDVADAVSAFCEQRHIPLIVDIQDLWPEAFKMALNVPVVSDLAFAPMARKADRVYRRADHIVAVSETYVRRGLSVNRKDSTGLSVYIGTDVALADRLIAEQPVKKPEGAFWLTYIGALGRSYDIPLVIDALKLLQADGLPIVFQVMGSGDRQQEYADYAAAAGVNAVFLGQCDYADMMRTLAASDAAVNPIIGLSVSSIINKVGDYAAAGVPVINTQNSEEYRRLLDDYQAGINCESGNAASVAQAIRTLYEDPSLRRRLADNSKRLGREKFDRSASYARLVDLIKRSADAR